MPEQAVGKMKSQSQHDAGEDLAADSALAHLEIGKRQCQHHHDEHRERVDDLLPEHDFVTRCLLAVFAQVFDIRNQFQQRHLFGNDHQDIENRRIEHRAPIGLRDPAYRGAALLEPGLYHIFQTPQVLPLVLARFRTADGAQPVVGIELVDIHLVDHRLRHDPFDVDEIRVVLHPESGAERLRHDRARRGLEPQFLRRLFAGRCHEFADKKSQHRKRHADLHQRDRHALYRYAGNPHYGVFGMSDHLRQRKQGADQRRDRQDLVGPAGQAKNHVQRREGQPVAAVPDIAQFLNEIEEREQKQQCRKYQRSTPEDLYGHIATDGLHRFCLRNGRTERRA